MAIELPVGRLEARYSFIARQRRAEDIETGRMVQQRCHRPRERTPGSREPSWYTPLTLVGNSLFIFHTHLLMVGSSNYSSFSPRRRARLILQSLQGINQKSNSCRLATWPSTESPSESATTRNFCCNHCLWDSGTFSVLTATARGHATKLANFGSTSCSTASVMALSMPEVGAPMMKYDTSPHSSLDLEAKLLRMRFCFHSR